MKKVVRILGLCALVALAFTSCKKKETNTVTFQASITQPTSDSRTHVVGSGITETVYWDLDDEIKVIRIEDGEDNDYTVQAGRFDGDYAEFEGDAEFLADLDKANKYSAFYPYANYVGDNVFLTITPIQEYVLAINSFANNFYPMYALNTASGNFPFHSNAGLLKLVFNSAFENQNVPTSVDISDVVITAPEGDVLAGTMKYDRNGNYIGIDTNYPIYNQVRMEVNKTVVSNDQTIIYFVLPEGALANGFNLKVYPQGGTTPLVDRNARPASECPAGKDNTIYAETITEMPLVYIPLVPPTGK